MPMQTKWVTYKKYSGFVVRGGPPIGNPVNSTMHTDRAVYLAGQLEAGAWGTVQGYDGCAISGGILHNIAVSPADLSQGTFFALLRECIAREKLATSEVVDALSKVGWKVAQDGNLRVISTGALVSGSAIRLELSGSATGNVLKTGPDSLRAKAWAERFFRLFSNPATFAAQSDYAAAWLAGGNKGNELDFYARFMLRPIDSIIGLRADAMPAEIELAMCVYHAFSVNAPGTAKGVLSPISDKVQKLSNPAPAVFAAQLIRALGKKQYGNWMDSPGDGSNRYDKTRKAVWARSDLWDKTLAKQLMPVDL